MIYEKVFLLILATMLLSGCSMSTPEDIEINEWEMEMGGVLQNGRSARIDDDISKWEPFTGDVVTF